MKKCIILLVVFLATFLTGCSASDAVYIKSDESLNVYNTKALTSKLTDNDGNIASVDGATESLKVIDPDRAITHEGYAFTVSDSVAADTTTVQWQIATADSLKYPHMVFVLSATGEATFLVTEGSDRDDGTALNEVNRRRVGTPNVAETVVTRAPTGGSTDGDIVLLNIRNGIVGLGGKSVEGGEKRGENEFILAPNTKYIISITTYAANYATCKLNWFEAANGDE